VCKSVSTTPLHPATIAVIALVSAFTVVIIVSAVCCVWGTCRNKHSDAKLQKWSSGGVSKLDTQYEYQPGSGAYTQDYGDHNERSMIRRSSDSEDDSCDRHSESYPMRKSPRHQIHNGTHMDTPSDRQNQDIDHGNKHISAHSNRQPWVRTMARTCLH
jgi:hypothetical protein